MEWLWCYREINVHCTKKFLHRTKYFAILKLFERYCWLWFVAIFESAVTFKVLSPPPSSFGVDLARSSVDRAFFFGSIRAK